MSAETEKRLAEVHMWYQFHENTLPRENLAKRLDFHERMNRNLLNLLTIMAHDIQMLEGTRRKLFLPKGINMQGDLKRFG